MTTSLIFVIKKKTFSLFASIRRQQLFLYKITDDIFRSESIKDNEILLIDNENRQIPDTMQNKSKQKMYALFFWAYEILNLQKLILF